VLRVGILLLIPAAILGLSGMARQGRDSLVHDHVAVDSRDTEGGTVEFTVMTYNVQGRPVLDDTESKFRVISPLLNRSDIVGVQECFQDHGLLWEQATHRTKFHHGTLKTPFRIVGSGLSTMARFPLLDLRTEFFASASELQNRLASKGMLLTRFDVRGVILDVYNAHLDAGSSLAAQQSRDRQGRQLVDFVRRHSPPEHAVIFLGDFNMSPSRKRRQWSDYEPLRYVSKRDMQARTSVFDRLVRDLAMKDASDEIHGPTLDDVDRVLFRSGVGQSLEPLSCERATRKFVDPHGRPLSDHVPVVARMRLTPGASRNR
jgi:endonuclease/exonuclease/phosphatase family metal-dependent hydrolase